MQWMPSLRKSKMKRRANSWIKLISQIVIDLNV
jgi:hypothetical protein